MGLTFPPNFPFTRLSGTPSNTLFLGPIEAYTQTASQSVQPIGWLVSEYSDSAVYITLPLHMAGSIVFARCWKYALPSAFASYWFYTLLSRFEYIDCGHVLASIFCHLAF